MTLCKFSRNFIKTMHIATDPKYIAPVPLGGDIQ